MSKQTQKIVLDTAPSDRIVKRVATFAFKGMRNLLSSAGKLPGIVSIAAGDVQEAWRDTSSPKA